jgi:hypothetical protein
MSATFALKQEKQHQKRASFSLDNGAATDDSLVNRMKESQRSAKRRKSCSDAMDMSSMFSTIAKEDKFEFPSIEFSFDPPVKEKEANQEKKASFFSGFRVGGLIRSKAFDTPRAA